jgi:hypothetical protein
LASGFAGKGILTFEHAIAEAVEWPKGKRHAFVCNRLSPDLMSLPQRHAGKNTQDRARFS